MCITKEISLLTFTVCSLSCLYLFKRNKKNDRLFSLLFGYIGFVQFLEYLMWIDQECSGFNQKVTKISGYFIILQPIISVLLFYLFIKIDIPPYIYGITLLYIFYAIPILYSNIKDNQCSKPCEGSEIGLHWPWVPDNIFLWTLFFLSLSLPFLLINNGIYFSLMTMVWILSGLIGSYRCKGILPIPSGSLWCLMAFTGPLFKIYYS